MLVCGKAGIGRGACEMIDQPDTGPDPAPVTVTVARRVAPGRTLRALPLVVAVCAASVVVTALMTWLVMPWLARLSAGWLYAPPRQR
jgi:antibiotic biosynthesis monooxygenase (ABM) superfamily enzyme